MGGGTDGRTDERTDRDRQRERHTHTDDAYTKKLKTIIKQKDIMSGGINE